MRGGTAVAPTTTATGIIVPMARELHGGKIGWASRTPSRPVSTLITLTLTLTLITPNQTKHAVRAAVELVVLTKTYHNGTILFFKHVHVQTGLCSTLQSEHGLQHIKYNISITTYQIQHIKY